MQQWANDVTGLNVVQGRQGVYVIPKTNSLDLNNRIIEVGKTLKKLLQTNNNNDLFTCVMGS